MSCTDRVIDLVDAIDPVLTEAPQSPSALARKAKVTTAEAHEALRWMTKHDYVIAVGNGCWTKYRRRNFGERN